MGGGSVYKKAQLGKVKDGEYAESNEKSYFRFFRYLVFELLASKRLQKMRKK